MGGGANFKNLNQKGVEEIRVETVVRDVASLKVMGGGANFENLPTRFGEGGHVFLFEGS